MKITLTGTGYPRPHRDRAGPGVLVQAAGRTLQFDAGRATIMRHAALGLHPRALDRVFLTHHHSDHMMGLTDLALSRWIVDDPRPVSPLTVMAPRGAATSCAARLLDPWRDDIAIRQAQTGREDAPKIHVEPFDIGDDAKLVWSEGALKVWAFKVEHAPVDPALGYAVDSPAGRLVISGDTGPCEVLESMAEGASVLIHEVIRSSVIGATRYASICDYHCDAPALGALAQRAGVGLLVLTHLIPAPDTETDRQALIEELRSGGYLGELWIGEDLMSVTLPRS